MRNRKTVKLDSVGSSRFCYHPYTRTGVWYISKNLRSINVFYRIIF